MKLIPGSKVRLSDGTVAEVRLVHKDGRVLVTITATGEDKMVQKSDLSKA